MSTVNKSVQFVMDRKFTISGFGHNIEFLPGEPRNVPPMLHAEAMRCGAKPLSDADVSHVPPVAAKPIEAQGDERSAIVIKAMDDIVNENRRMDFGANSLPTTKAIYRRCGIELDNKERDAMWTLRNKQMQAAKHPTNNNLPADEEIKIAVEAEQALDEKEASEDIQEEVAEAAEEQPAKKAAPKKKRAAKKTADTE